MRPVFIRFLGPLPRQPWITHPRLQGEPVHTPNMTTPFRTALVFLHRARLHYLHRAAVDPSVHPGHAGGQGGLRSLDRHGAAHAVAWNAIDGLLHGSLWRLVRSVRAQACPSGRAGAVHLRGRQLHGRRQPADAARGAHIAGSGGGVRRRARARHRPRRSTARTELPR